MKKRLLLLLLLIACAPVAEQTVQPPEPAIQPTEKPAPTPDTRLHGNIIKYTIRDVPPFTLASTDAIQDSFSIIPAERYDARYQAGSVTVLVHVFKFTTREQLDVVLNSEFFHIINNGATRHQGHIIALYLTQEDHRVVIWSSGNFLIYMETFLPEFAAREVFEAYLSRYPSDLETRKCLDTDGDNYFRQGKTTRVKTDSTIMEWTDTCIRDFPMYKNQQYKTQKGITEEDGLLEGQCQHDQYLPGYINEHACPRGCQEGACNLK